MIVLKIENDINRPVFRSTIISNFWHHAYKALKLLSCWIACIISLGLPETLAQDAYLDSLSNIVDTTEDATTKLKTQLGILRQLSTTDLVKCEAAIPLSKQLLAQNKDIDIEFSGRLSLAQSYYVLSRFQEAREQLEQIFPFASKVKDQSDVFYAHIIFGFLQEEINTDTALFHMNQALLIAKKLKDVGLLGAGYSNIGNIYRGRGLVKQAEKYYADAIAILRTGGTKKHLAIALLNLGLLTDDEELFEALQHEAKQIYSSLGYAHKVAELDLNLALRNFTKKDYKKAKRPYLRYIQSYSESEKPVTYYGALIPLGLCYLIDGQPDSAGVYLEEAEAYFQDDNFPSLAEALAYHEGLMKLSAAKKNFEKAYFHSWRRVQIFDSLEYSKNAEFAAEFDVRYETEKKEKQLIAQQLQIEKEKHKRSRTLLTSLGVLALMTIIGGWYFFALRRRKQETQHKMDMQALEADALKELNQMKSRWFENISHDLRTPLTLIAAPIKDLLKSTKSATAQNLLQIADRNSQHLLQLTNEMLELARLENTVIPLRKTTKASLTEINKIVHAFDSFATEKEINIEASIDLSATDYYTFDYDKYEKIFNNLFKNAILYSPPNARVKVDVRINGGILTTKITDQGLGIPADEIPMLFDKYFRASHQQTAQIEGAGLGLSIVKELLTILGGTIEVASKLNHGSEFSFSIPVLKAEKWLEPIVEVKANEEEKGLALLLGSERRTLLIVEDNREMSNYLNTVLSSEYETEIAGNGIIALQKMAAKSYDLIISDVMMPGLDGFSFKQRVNSMTQHSQTPFIFLSAKALDEDKLKGLRLGIDDYITKPFVTQELKIRIHNILSRKLVRDEMLDEVAEGELGNDNTDEKTSVDQARDIVRDQLSDINFGVEQLAEGMHYSSRQLNRILKKHTGLTSVQFILELRLQHARTLLLDGQVYSVKEVQHEVGIQSQSYFSRKYTERFGCSPGSHVL